MSLPLPFVIWVKFARYSLTFSSGTSAGTCILIVAPSYVVKCLQEAHRAALRPHHDAVGDDAVAPELHPAQHRAVRDSGRGEDAVRPFRKVLEMQLPLQVREAHLPGALLLLFVPELEPPLESAAEALDGSGRDDTLVRRPDAEEHVHPALGQRRGDGSRDIAIRDEQDARSRVPYLLDELLVPIPFEHHDGDFLGFLAEGISDRTDVVPHRGVEVNRVLRFRPSGNLVHVCIGSSEQRAFRRSGKNRDGVRPAERDAIGAFQGIDRDIHLRAGAGADALPYEEHGRLITFALSDDHFAVELDVGKALAHLLHGSLVRAVLVTLAQPLRAANCCSLSDTDELQREIAFHSLAGEGNRRFKCFFIQSMIICGNFKSATETLPAWRLTTTNSVRPRKSS